MYIQLSCRKHTQTEHTHNERGGTKREATDEAREREREKNTQDASSRFTVDLYCKNEALRDFFPIQPFLPQACACFAFPFPICFEDNGSIRTYLRI